MRTAAWSSGKTDLDTLFPHPLLLSPSPASLRLPDFSPRTIRDLCWRPRSHELAGRGAGVTLRIPECGVCRSFLLGFGDGRDPAVSMALGKQEETVRESRYFTALKAYKHGARGEVALLSSKPERRAAPTPPRREPGAGRREARSSRAARRRLGQGAAP